MSIKSFAYQIVYFCIGLLIIFFQILPLQTTPQTWSGPNVLLVFFAAIVSKRPEFTSSFLIASIFLIEDFFLMRPPGLMSSLTVLGFYLLKRKIQNFKPEVLIFNPPNVKVIPQPTEYASKGGSEIVFAQLVFSTSSPLVVRPSLPLGSKSVFS